MIPKKNVFKKKLKKYVIARKEKNVRKKSNLEKNLIFNCSPFCLVLKCNPNIIYENVVEIQIQKHTKILYLAFKSNLKDTHKCLNTQAYLHTHKYLNGAGKFN